MVDRLDEERLEILRSWGIGLASDDREELRAAGKAITVLIDEIDRLQVDLWNSRAVERQGSDLVEPLMAAAQGTALRDRLTRHRPQV
jgi:hypothetical protein